MEKLVRVRRWLIVVAIVSFAIEDRIQFDDDSLSNTVESSWKIHSFRVLGGSFLVIWVVRGLCTSVVCHYRATKRTFFRRAITGKEKEMFCRAL